MSQLSTELSTIPNPAAGRKKASIPPINYRVGHYPESLAKSANRSKPRWPQFEDGEALKSDYGLANNEDYLDAFLAYNEPLKEPDYIYKCVKGFVWGESSQNNFYKMVSCGKEWCSDCGAKHSIPHDRRISRHLKSFLGLHQAGFPIQYLVITIPKELRQLYRSKEALRKFRRYWIEKLKREGENEAWQWGVSRYHYCGEDGYTWKPHLNILSIASYIPKETLRTWRAELGRWFKMEHQLDFTPTANIYCAWSRDADKIRHWLTYVMRATQIKYNKWNEETINGFRNVAPFKNRDFEVPEYKAPVPDQEEDLIKKAADEGFDLLPDGTREKITWRMKYSLVRKRMVPELVMVEHTRLDELILIKRGFWKEPKFKAPPNPQPPDPGEKEISEEIFCPF
jgi:hypothetical protein